MDTTQYGHSSRTHAGFTLVEVLISLGILASGLLGITALQNEALKFNHAAYLESQALFLINDMMERIRANSTVAAYAMGFTEGVSVAADCALVICDGEEMAAWDKGKWRAMVENSAYLPGAESEIRFNPLNHEYTISIRYDWSKLAGSDEKRTVSVTSRIQGNA